MFVVPAKHTQIQMPLAILGKSTAKENKKQQNKKQGSMVVLREEEKGSASDQFAIRMVSV